MNAPLKLTAPLPLRRSGSRGRYELGPKPSPAPLPPRVPRVARLMALAIRLDGLIRDGVIRDQSEAARLGKVTRARMSQIMNLLYLAPDLQEQLLHLTVDGSGRSPLILADLQPLSAEPNWRKQRRMWAHLKIHS